MTSQKQSPSENGLVQDCSICLDSLAASAHAQLAPCNHSTFHLACVRQWISGFQGITCPLCRAPIRTFSDATGKVYSPAFILLFTAEDRDDFVGSLLEIERITPQFGGMDVSLRVFERRYDADGSLVVFTPEEYAALARPPRTMALVSVPRDQFRVVVGFSPHFAEGSVQILNVTPDVGDDASNSIEVLSDGDLEITLVMREGGSEI